MQRLSSWLGGEWVEGTGKASILYNPTNHEAVAETATGGLDFEKAFHFARDVGGRALSSMTFAERGAMLAAMSKAIHSVREELIDIGRINAGNTRGDAKFDIDGATATLMYYAKLGESLGAQRVMVDGDAIQIGGARLQGQHILTARPGAALHINAFNFPAWGLAEKAACALLAGMPVISKPATSTAYMTWRMVQAIAEANVLPEGALSLVCGSAHDLLDHVTWSDVVAFTGGADTADLIRRHPQVLSTGAALNLEADSLNTTVLAPEVDDATYDAFITSVQREMTQKAGQKCTATRRILVPQDRLDEVIDDLGDALARTVVGDPALKQVRMGPLSTAAQVRSAHEGIAALREEAEIVYGQVEAMDLEGVAAGQGCFVTPLLLKARDADAGEAIHDVEVFGPVATVLPYDGRSAHAADLVQRARGCLVTSLYVDDRRFMSDAIYDWSGYNGRLVITDAKIAAQAYGPGMALPHLLHGGPGRAGGGEELGGPRGMRFYQQRCAIQGNGPLIAKCLSAD
ncbi:MAG: 3,4-dehydroadipyl-CoA semialdehyde dehydrogenase [Myxococcota bacterium]|nr:3,4-dehydroadipyl-CoA semialdehyde dehydrogenase [Myxococcota bacterium]